MDLLPVEILLYIGLISEETYHGMLAVPRFARAVTCGYILEAMRSFGYGAEVIKDSNTNLALVWHQHREFVCTFGQFHRACATNDMTGLISISTGGRWFHNDILGELQIEYGDTEYPGIVFDGIWSSQDGERARMPSCDVEFCATKFQTYPCHDGCLPWTVTEKGECFWQSIL